MHSRVMEIIQNKAVDYKVRNHADLGEIRSPGDVAAALGYDITRITKTLFLRATEENKFLLMVSPVSTKIDLKQLADLVKVRRLQLASKDELNDKLGYPSHGVSPLGSNDIPIFMDSSLLNHETILVGAGVLGQEIELQPYKLQELTSATLI